MSISGIGRSFSAVIRSLAYDFVYRYASIKEIIRNIVVPGMILETCLFLSFFFLRNSHYNIRQDVIGIFFGIFYFTILMSFVDDKKLKFWVNIVPYFRYDCFLICHVLFYAIVGIIILSPSWIVLHSYDCVLWSTITLLYCLITMLFASREYPLAGLLIALATGIIGFMFHEPEIVGIIAALLLIPAVLSFSGIDRLRYSRHSSRFRISLSSMRTRQRRKSQIDSLYFKHRGLFVLFSSLPHRSMALFIMFLAGICALALSIWGTYYSVGAAYLAGFLVALVLCDQIGVNLASSQTRQFDHMRREGINILPLAHTQMRAYTVLSSLLPLSVFGFAMRSLLLTDPFRLLIQMLGQASIYTCMSIVSLILSVRCAPVSSGLYSIHARAVLFFELISAVIAMAFDMLLSGLPTLLILFPVVVTVLKLLTRFTKAKFAMLESTV